MRIAGLIALYAVIAIVGVVFLGSSVPQCFGDSTGHMSQACVDRWLANRPLFEAFISTPWPAVGFFFVASGLTILWSRRRSRRSR